jgi:periplasmic protein CpxP/Spy
MRSRVLFAAAALAAVALPAAAQAPYGQPGYGQSGYGQPSYGQPAYGSQPSPSSGYDQRSYGGAPGPQGGYPPAGSDRGGAYADGNGAPGEAGGAPDLYRDLGLRPEQRAALAAYQQAVTPSAAEQQRMEADAQRLASLPTPQRLDAIAQQMSRDQAAFAQQAQAVRRFYAQLTPAQQRRFDQLTAPPADEGDGGQGGYPQAGAAPSRGGGSPYR